MKKLNYASMIAVIATGFITPVYASQTELALKSESIKLSHEAIKIESLNNSNISSEEFQSHQQQQVRQEEYAIVATLSGANNSGFDV